MKLGIVSAIYDGFTFEEAVENAVQNGCECMEEIGRASCRERV